MSTPSIFNNLKLNVNQLHLLGGCHTCGTKTTLFCDHGKFDDFISKKAANYAEKEFYIEDIDSQEGQDHHTLSIKLPQLRPDFTQKEAKLEETALETLLSKIRMALDQFKNYLRQMGLDVSHYNANIRNGKIIINIPDSNHRDQFKQFLNSRIREKSLIPKNNHDFEPKIRFTPSRNEPLRFKK